ncbi:hypothetical protein WA026_002844 [Henosepilachna vigintioctopunctata]|uniref:Ankyrin repeat protein n=1 Tax=Henosepilachna vigintioctopunctata TaxID=420089 RepID=A0AAW1TW30_9CUCU
MEYDADINAINEKGATPVHSAVNANCGLLVDVLLKEGADINIKDNTDIYGNTAFHLVNIGKSTGKMKKFVRLLMEYDADINAINEEGPTPVHTAVNANCGLLVDVLLKEGADINIKGNMGINLRNQLIIQHECKLLVDLDVLKYINGYEGFMNSNIKCGGKFLTLDQKLIHNYTINF